MKIIGCDFHPRFQQIFMLDEETKWLEQKLHRHLDHPRAYIRLDVPESG
jgi:hypothetical protein